MLFRVSKKLRGEIVIPSIDRSLSSNALVNLNKEEYIRPDIQSAIKKGYLIPEEGEKKEFIVEEEKNTIKMKNIGKNPLTIYDIILNPGEVVYIHQDLKNSSYVQTAISMKILEIIEEKEEENIEKEKLEENIPEENNKEINIIEEKLEENNIKVVEHNKDITESDILEELENMNKTNSSSWDPKTQTMLNKKESHEKVFSNKPSGNNTIIDWVDKEENPEEKENKKEIIKKKTTKNKIAKKITRKRRTKKKIAKKREIRPPVKGTYSPKNEDAPSEDDVIFSLDSQGNVVENIDNISFVDKEQEQERKDARPDLLNNLEID